MSAGGVRSLAFPTFESKWRARDCIRFALSRRDRKALSRQYAGEKDRQAYHDKETGDRKVQKARTRISVAGWQGRKRLGVGVNVKILKI